MHNCTNATINLVVQRKKPQYGLEGGTVRTLTMNVNPEFKPTKS